MKSSHSAGFLSPLHLCSRPAQIVACVALLLALLPSPDARAAFVRQYDTDFDNRFFEFTPFSPEPVVSGDPPFDTVFAATDSSLLGVQGRDGLEVQFDGSAPGGPVRTSLIYAQTETDLIPNADRYLVSTRVRVNRMERHSNEPPITDSGFFLDFDLGNAASGGFTVEFAKDFSGRNSIYLTNSLNGVTRRVGTFETGDDPVWVTALINATNQRMSLKIDNETVWRGDIDMNTALSYSPTFAASLIEVTNVQEASQTSQVAMMNFKSYYNPEPGMAMVGVGALGLLAKRRRAAQR